LSRRQTLRRTLATNAIIIPDLLQAVKKEVLICYSKVRIYYSESAIKNKFFSKKQI